MGFQNFVRAGKSGMMYDFFLYEGSKSTGKDKCKADDVVRKLCETLPKNENHRIFFDNWFSTIELCLELKANGFLSTCTFQSNRLQGCPLQTEKDLKKEGRGDYSCDQNSSFHLLKWMDNSCVHAGSTYTSMNATAKVKRWEKSAKNHVDVSCPGMIIEYNKSMGGVDLADMLISIYQKVVKSKSVVFENSFPLL